MERIWYDRAEKKHENYEPNKCASTRIVGSMVEFSSVPRDARVQFSDKTNFLFKTIIEEMIIFLTYQLDLASLAQ